MANWSTMLATLVGHKGTSSTLRIDGAMLEPSKVNANADEIESSAFSTIMTAGDEIVGVLAQHPGGLTFGELQDVLASAPMRSSLAMMLTGLINAGRVIYAPHTPEQRANNYNAFAAEHLNCINMPLPTVEGDWLPYIEGVKVDEHGLYKLSYDEWISRHAAAST